MSNLVSPLLGADVLVFKPLTDQEQVRPATQANVMKSTSHPEDLMDYTIVERDFTVFPANTENVLFERVNSETLYEVGGGKDRSEISEGVEKYFKMIDDVVLFKLESLLDLESYGVDSTSPKWHVKPVGPKDAPQVPNSDEIVCVMPIYRNSQYKSAQIDRKQELFISKDQYQSELFLDDWVSLIF